MNYLVVVNGINLFFRVLLVEAGSEDQPNLKIALPLLAFWNVNSDVDWYYKSAPQKHSSQNFNNRVGVV